MSQYDAGGIALLYYWETFLTNLHEIDVPTLNSGAIQDALVGLLVPVMTQYPVIQDTPQELIPEATRLRLGPILARTTVAIGAGIAVARALAAEDPADEKSNKVITVRKAIEVFDRWFAGDGFTIGAVHLNGGASFFFPARVAAAWRESFRLGIHQAALPQKGHTKRVAVFRRKSGRPNERAAKLSKELGVFSKQKRV